MYIILLFSMIFCHIVDDYYLQGILAKLKQKSWWEENTVGAMYKDDYLPALIEHAFSWSFMIHIPIFAFFMLTHTPFDKFAILCTVILNTAIHAYVDHLKANKHKINLMLDQLIHFDQVALTACYYVFVCF